MSLSSVDGDCLLPLGALELGRYEHDRERRALLRPADERLPADCDLRGPGECDQVTVQLVGHGRDELLALPGPTLQPERADPGRQEPVEQLLCVLDLVDADVQTDDLEVHALRSEEHTSELQSRQYLVCRLL